MIHQLLRGCPVCRQRTRHLVFCRYRPPLLDAPPATWMVLGTLPFWMLVGAVVAGWLGIGVAVVVIGLAELGVASLAEAARAVRPTRIPVPEEVVGALYPREMRHVHRRKGVCTLHCRPRRAA